MRAWYVSRDDPDAVWLGSILDTPGSPKREAGAADQPRSPCSHGTGHLLAEHAVGGIPRSTVILALLVLLEAYRSCYRRMALHLVPGRGLIGPAGHRLLLVRLAGHWTAPPCLNGLAESSTTLPVPISTPTGMPVLCRSPVIAPVTKGSLVTVNGPGLTRLATSTSVTRTVSNWDRPLMAAWTLPPAPTFSAATESAMDGSRAPVYQPGGLPRERVTEPGGILGCHRRRVLMHRGIAARAGGHNVVSKARPPGWPEAVKRFARVGYPAGFGVIGLIGHSGTSVTEAVYRQQIRPALTKGAEAMDEIFGA